MEAVCTAAHLFGILNKAPPPSHTLQPPSRNSMTAEQNVTGGGLFRQSVGEGGGEGGMTLPLPARRRFWFGSAAPGPVPRLRGQACLPSEKRGPPFRPPHFVSSPPWQQMPHAAPGAFSRRGDVGERQPGSPEPMSVSRAEKALPAGRQAACRPLLSRLTRRPSGTARLHVLCVD